MIEINTDVSDPLDIPGVPHSRNASVPSIRPVHLLPILVQISINGVVVLLPDTPTVHPRIPVNAIMIVVITNLSMILINTDAVLRQDIPGVPHAINVSVPGRLNVLFLVFLVEISINTDANLPPDIPTVPILGNVNDQVIVMMVFYVLLSMNQSRVVMDTTFPTCVKPSERDIIPNNVRVLVVTMVLTILPVVATFMNRCIVMDTNTRTYV